MRLSKETLSQIEGKMPPFEGGETIVLEEWEASGEDIEGINLIELDKGSGKPLKIWSYEVTEHEDYRGAEGNWVPKGYKLSEVTELKYQPFIYTHPLLNIEMEAELQEVRNWEADKAGRKRERLDASRLLIIFEDSWDPRSERPRGYQVLEERGYEPQEPQEPLRRISVSKRVQWIEKYRTFLFSNATLLYMRNADGLMVLWYSKIDGPVKYSGVDFPERLKPPIEMGEAGFIDF